MKTRCGFLIDVHYDVLTEPHGELIDRVVDIFFEDCIDTVPGVCSISQPADVHAVPETDVLHALHRPDALIRIIPGRREVFIFHIVSWFWLRINTLALPKHGN